MEYPLDLEVQPVATMGGKETTGGASVLHIDALPRKDAAKAFFTAETDPQCAPETQAIKVTLYQAGQMQGEAIRGGVRCGDGKPWLLMIGLQRDGRFGVEMQAFPVVSCFERGRPVPTSFNGDGKDCQPEGPQWAICPEPRLLFGRSQSTLRATVLCTDGRPWQGLGARILHPGGCHLSLNAHTIALQRDEYGQWGNLDGGAVTVGDQLGVSGCPEGRTTLKVCEPEGRCFAELDFDVPRAPGSPSTPPNIQFSFERSMNRIVVIAADAAADWKDVRVSISGGQAGACDVFFNGGTTGTTIATSGTDGTVTASSQPVSPRDYLRIDAPAGTTCTLTLTHTPTGGLIGPSGGWILDF